MRLRSSQPSASLKWQDWVRALWHFAQRLDSGYKGSGRLSDATLTETVGGAVLCGSAGPPASRCSICDEPEQVRVRSLKASAPWLRGLTADRFNNGRDASLCRTSHLKAGA